MKNLKRKRVYGFKRRKRFKSARVPRSLAETKVFDVPIGQLVSTTSTVQLISGCSNGTGDHNRIGNLISWKYMHVALWFNQVPSAVIANQSDYCRVAFVYDKSPNAALPGYSTIFQATDNAGGNTSDPFVKSNNDTKHRFTILYNQNFFLPGVGGLAVINNGGVAEGVAPLRVNFFKKLNFRISRFVGTGATIADIESGAFYILTETQTIAPAQSTTTLQGSIRMAYTDK